MHDLLELLKVVGEVLAVLSFGCAALLFVYRAGFAASQSKNGYVKRDDCHRHIEKVDGDLCLIHKKVNRTALGVARIEGALGIQPTETEE